MSSGQEYLPGIPGRALFITDAARNPQLVGRLGDFH